MGREFFFYHKRCPDCFIFFHTTDVFRMLFSMIARPFLELLPEINQNNEHGPKILRIIKKMIKFKKLCTHLVWICDIWVCFLETHFLKVFWAQMHTLKIGLRKIFTFFLIKITFLFIFFSKKRWFYNYCDKFRCMIWF